LQGWTFSLPLSLCMEKGCCEVMHCAVGTRVHLQSPLLHNKKEGNKLLLETPLLHLMIELKSLIISKHPPQNPQNSAIFTNVKDWRERLITGELPP